MRGHEDPTLLASAQKGERIALERLWEEHVRWLRPIVLAHGTMGAELEDVLQETALTFVRRIGDVQRPEAVGGWLRQVALNAIRTAGRRRRVRQGTCSLSDHEGHIADPEEARRSERHRSRDRLEAVMTEIHKLPIDLREPLMLKTVEGMSQRRIASILELSESAVESRLARARRLLRERLTREHRPRKEPLS
ncbi:MAG: RNA polymerase sigma factor [Planctomycetota bacterium]